MGRINKTGDISSISRKVSSHSFILSVTFFLMKKNKTKNTCLPCLACLVYLEYMCSAIVGKLDVCFSGDNNLIKISYTSIVLNYKYMLNHEVEGKKKD